MVVEREGGLLGNLVSLVKLSNVGLIHGEGNKEPCVFRIEEEGM